MKPSSTFSLVVGRAHDKTGANELRVRPSSPPRETITQSRQAADSLSESERRFRVLADTAPVLVWMAAPDKLCDFFNQTWLDFTGRTLQQEMGNGWAEGVHPDDLSGCLNQYVAAFDARQPFELEYRLRRHDGEYRWILDRGVPRYSPTGEFLGYIGSAIDVTDRRLQEEAVRRSEERYREVVETQTDFVCRFLPDTTLTFVNGSFCRFLGRERVSVLGKQFLSFLSPDTRAGALEHLRRTAATPGPSEWECETSLVDGRAAFVHWVCYPIADSRGQLQELQAIGQDVTDRKRAEDADRKLVHAARLAALGELTAMVAHEINQPLCAIVGNAEAAAAMVRSSDPPNEELRQTLADISKDSLRVSEVIQGIRALTRKRDPERLAIDLNETVASVLRLVGGDALRRHVEIIQELTPDLPMVLADAPSLQQVLVNLIVNGMDAMAETREGARRLTITTAPHDGHVVVAVADHGHGIPPERMPRLFESFFTTKRDGVGLGLSIARSIIQAHHGRIWAENRAEGGSTFYFTVRSAELSPVPLGEMPELQHAGADVPAG